MPIPFLDPAFFDECTATALLDDRDFGAKFGAVYRSSESGRAITHHALNLSYYFIVLHRFLSLDLAAEIRDEDTAPDTDLNDGRSLNTV